MQSPHAKLSCCSTAPWGERRELYQCIHGDAECEEGTTELCRKGFRSAPLKDLFLSVTHPESSIQGVKVLTCAKKEKSFGRGNNAPVFPAVKEIACSKELSSTINESTNYRYMGTNYRKLESTDGA